MSEIILPKSGGGVDFSQNAPSALMKYWDLKDLLKTQNIIDQNYLHQAGLTRGDTFQKRKLALWVELGELVNEWREIFKFWSNKVTDKEKALFEYVDGLHFLLSLGNDLNIPNFHDQVVKFKDPIDHIFILSISIANIGGMKSYYDTFSLYRGLGDHFGFTQEEVEAAYYEKNKVNIERKDHILGSVIDIKI